MLNPFPQLLALGFFAPTLLRVAAALVFFYITYVLTTKRREVLETPLPIVGTMPLWLLRSAAAIIALIALSLLVGYDTQWAAILGAVVALKCLVWRHRYPTLIPLSHIASLLLLAICLSLLVTGAGGFAQDLPL